MVTEVTGAARAAMFRRPAPVKKTERPRGGVPSLSRAKSVTDYSSAGRRIGEVTAAFRTERALWADVPQRTPFGAL